MHKNSIKSGKTRGQPKGRSPRKNRCPKPTCLCCRPAGRQAAPLTFIGMVQSRWWVNSKNRACSMIDLDSTQAASWNKEEISGFGSAWHCTGRFIWSLWGSGSPCCISRRPLPETLLRSKAANFNLEDVRFRDETVREGGSPCFRLNSRGVNRLELFLHFPVNSHIPLELTRVEPVQLRFRVNGF